jgi:hypothetical protein
VRAVIRLLDERPGGPAWVGAAKFNAAGSPLRRNGGNFTGVLAVTPTLAAVGDAVHRRVAEQSWDQIIEHLEEIGELHAAAQQ